MSKVALVTGGSGGIGSAICYRLARDGFTVAVAYSSSESKACGVVEKIVHDGGQAFPIYLNIKHINSICLAVECILKKHQKIDILVNNGAFSQEKPFLDIDDEDWDQMLAINLRGPFALCQEVLPKMLENRFGRIVNIVSIGGQWGGINQIHYASAKAGLIGLTRSIAKTFSSHSVTCNAVSPGLVATEMTAAELISNEGREKVKNIPCGRLGLVDEIAGAVSYLVGPDGGYITGQTLNLNGGMYFG